MGKHNRQQPSVTPVASASLPSAEPIEDPMPEQAPVFVRATHGMSRAARDSAGEVLWFSPTGSEHDVDAATLDILLADPILQVRRLDVPQPKPANMVAIESLVSFVDALAHGEDVPELEASKDAPIPPMHIEPILTASDDRQTVSTDDRPQIHVTKGADDRDDGAGHHVEIVNAPKIETPQDAEK